MEYFIKYLVIYLFCLQDLQILQCDAECLDTSALVTKQLGLSSSQFWSAKARDVEQCMKLCVRRKPCLSITFDTETRTCELNKGTQSDTPTRPGTALVYSEFQSWPASVDVNCHARPCQVSEVCIPGSLTTGTSDCSYTCLHATRDVCPMPEGGVSNGRTVGAINQVICPKGETGGGSSRCLESKVWDGDITPCLPIHEHQCSNDTLCEEIKATCSDNKCQCVGQAYTFDESIKECVLDCQVPPSVTYAVVTGNSSVMMYECNTGYYPKDGSIATITCTVDGWSPTNAFTCYTCSASPQDVPGASISGEGKERQYICDQYPNLHPKHGTGDGNFTCTPDNGWTPQGVFKCAGLRVKQRPGESRSYTGYLEMFDDDRWKIVTYEAWSWKATTVACRQLFNLSFGGSYHKNWFATVNPDRVPNEEAIKLENINCNGNEDNLDQCIYNPKGGDKNKETALTCFDFDVTTSGYVTLDNIEGNNDGQLLVKIDASGELGAVCGSGWGDAETDVTCKSLVSTWRRDHDCTNSCKGTLLDPIFTNHLECDGTEPHLFYCRNKGWGYKSDCDASKLVGIRCHTSS